MDEMKLFQEFLKFKEMMEKSKAQPQQQQTQKKQQRQDKLSLTKLEDGGVFVNLNAFNFRIQKYKNNYYIHIKIAPFVKKNSKGVFTIRISSEEVKLMLEALNIIKKEMDNVVDSNQALKQ